MNSSFVLFIDNFCHLLDDAFPFFFMAYFFSSVSSARALLTVVVVFISKKIFFFLLLPLHQIKMKMGKINAVSLNDGMMFKKKKKKTEAKAE